MRLVLYFLDGIHVYELVKLLDEILDVGLAHWHGDCDPRHTRRLRVAHSQRPNIEPAPSNHARDFIQHTRHVLHVESEDLLRPLGSSPTAVSIRIRSAQHVALLAFPSIGAEQYIVRIHRVERAHRIDAHLVLPILHLDAPPRINILRPAIPRHRIKQILASVDRNSTRSAKLQDTKLGEVVLERGSLARVSSQHERTARRPHVQDSRPENLRQIPKLCDPLPWWRLHLHQHQLALDMVNVGDVFDVAHVHELGDLLAQVPDRAIGAGRNDRKQRLLLAKPHRQTLDVGPTTGKDAGNSVDHARLVRHKHAQYVLPDADFQILRLVREYIVRFPLRGPRHGPPATRVGVFKECSPRRERHATDAQRALVDCGSAHQHLF
mmetsp:Transcript_12970/g.37247  ORF Transcript_12970/g.37247 Transcript_12970/m.37247 type:complete len:379 (-) Transcript_12970:27-1163(-)